MRLPKWLKWNFSRTRRNEGIGRLPAISYGEGEGPMTERQRCYWEKGLTLRKDVLKIRLIAYPKNWKRFFMSLLSWEVWSRSRDDSGWERRSSRREYRWWDSNPYFRRNSILNRARLPIPPRWLFPYSSQNIHRRAKTLFWPFFLMPSIAEYTKFTGYSRKTVNEKLTK